MFLLFIGVRWGGYCMCRVQNAVTRYVAVYCGALWLVAFYCMVRSNGLVVYLIGRLWQLSSAGMRLCKRFTAATMVCIKIRENAGVVRVCVSAKLRLLICWILAVGVTWRVVCCSVLQYGQGPRGWRWCRRWRGRWVSWGGWVDGPTVCCIIRCFEWVSFLFCTTVSHLFVTSACCLWEWVSFGAGCHVFVMSAFCFWECRLRWLLFVPRRALNVLARNVVGFTQPRVIGWVFVAAGVCVCVFFVVSRGRPVGGVVCAAIR